MYENLKIISDIVIKSIYDLGNWFTSSKIISFLAGFLSAIFAEPIRKNIFKPKLTLDFNNTQDYKSKTIYDNNGEVFEIYVRARVYNKKKILAENCRAFLINIEKKENGKFTQTIYADSLQLAWSCQTDNTRFSAMDLSYGVNLFFDIFKTDFNRGEEEDPSTRKSVNNFVPLTYVIPKRYLHDNLFSQTGTYRITIQVTSANADPVKMALILEWKGHSEDFYIYKEL